MVHVRGLRVRLRIADAAFRAVIAADAALAALCQVNVVSEEDWKRVGSNPELIDQSRQLRVKPVDVHQSSGEAEWRTGFAIRRRWAQSLLRFHGRTAQQYVIIGVGFHRTPEIGALERVFILRRAHVYAALGVRRRGVKN